MTIGSAQAPVPPQESVTGGKETVSGGAPVASGAGRHSEALWGWVFLAPFALLFTIAFLLPMLLSVWASFFHRVSEGGLFGGGEAISRFVGLENYRGVVTDVDFWAGMGRVLLFGIIQIPVMIVGAMALALLLDTYVLRRVAPGLRLVYFLPFAIPGVIAALVWTYLYSPGLSPLIRGAEAAVGWTPNFFHPDIILLSMANMTTWTFMGYNMLIFLAALQAVPHDLYEAARIDGASEWAIMRRIKVPLLRPAALLAVLLSIIGTVQLFNEPTVLKAVNPWMPNDYTPMMMAYSTMMGGTSPSGDGPAAAVSIVMALVAGLLAVIYTFIQRKADD